MKRIGKFFFSLIVCISICLSAYGSTHVRALPDINQDTDKDAKKRLTEMTDDELRSFLSEYVRGYEQDEKYKEDKLWLLKEFIDQFDSVGETLIPYSWAEYGVWSEQIDEGVRLYYGEEEAEHAPQSRYTPVQNSFWQIPANMTLFRCYGYAIGMHATMNPGFTDVNYVLDLPNATVFDLADLVITDLHSSYFNQACVKRTTICPNSSVLSSGRSAICVRKGSDGNNHYDYHFMKLTSSGWLHKPGKTAILKHLLSLSASVNWLSEVTSDGVNWVRGDIQYSGDIVYLIYQSNHTYSLQYTGVGYHAGARHYYEKAYICTNCGDMYGAYYVSVPCSGPPCSGPRECLE